MKYDEDSIRKRKKRANTLGKILYIILIILIYNLVLVGISFISKHDFNGFFGYKAYNITTNSMEPNINIGDIIIVKKRRFKIFRFFIDCYCIRTFIWFCYYFNC